MILGVLGAGQLGRMLGLAGIPLGIRCRFYDEPQGGEGEAPPAASVGAFHAGRFDDPAALDRFADGLDACTLEFENVPVAALERVAARVPVFPCATALATAQDRALEKACFNALGIRTTRFELADSRESLARAVAAVGTPCVVKSRRMGYDGKGQKVLRSCGEEDLDGAWGAVKGCPCIVEEFVPFEHEVSIIGARGRDGSCVFYPLSLNEHREGILRVSRSPAGLGGALQDEAERALRAVMEHLGYVGVLTVEFFVSGGALVANEMAPRVHNSGHWTIEGSSCSQFENHLRAVCGLPLAAPECRPSAMVNLIGAPPRSADVLGVAGARLHLYGKSARPGRKVGHVTIVGDRLGALDDRVRRLCSVALDAERAATGS